MYVTPSEAGTGRIDQLLEQLDAVVRCGKPLPRKLLAVNCAKWISADEKDGFRRRLFG
jgi:hypothetical protein